MIGPHPSSIKAGKIAARVLDEVRREVKPGAKVYTLCTMAEKKIIDYGGRPAFPTCISINDVVAHYTSPPGDRSIIPDWGVVKVDVGVHIDGHIADTALTVDMDGSLEGLTAATDDALQEAIELMQPGTSLSVVGRQIERVIRAYGLRAIEDICGHELRRYKLHGGKKVPNGKLRNAGTVEVGDYYAIEPYATSGGGVGDTDNVYVFTNIGTDRQLEGVAEKLRVHLREKYGPLPFALRWIGTKQDGVDVLEPLRELLKNRIVRGSAVVAEKNGRPVAQSEHTVFITENGPIVLTKRD